MRVVFVLFLGAVASLHAQDSTAGLAGRSDLAPLSSVSSSAELVETQFAGSYLYPPANVLDANGATTWAPGGRGIGASLTISFSEVVAYDEIQIVNGFAGPNDLYNKNNRIKTLQISHIAGKSHFQSAEYELQDQISQFQSIHFDQTQLASTLVFAIKEIFRGNKYDDTCLSDIRLLYQGQVIPFGNAAELIATQTKQAKALLGKSTAKDFLANDIGVPLVNRENRGYFLDQSGGAYTGTYDPKANSFTVDESMEYSVATTRLLLKQTVGYVVSQRSLVIIPDGLKGVTINGVYYTRIKPATAVTFLEDEGL